MAYQEATLYAKVAGYLKTINVDKGDTVKEGDTLAEIEAPEMEADLVKARAEAEAAQIESDDGGTIQLDGAKRLRDRLDRSHVQLAGQDEGGPPPTRFDRDVEAVRNPHRLPHDRPTSTFL